jgi:hypothetical protein
MSDKYQVGDKIAVVGEVLEVHNLWMDVNIEGDNITFRTDVDIKVVERKKTPGQKAFEGFYKAYRSSIYPPWDECKKTTQEAWEAAAAAVTEES